MANKKITQLPAITTIADTDILVAVTNPGTVPETKKISFSIIKSNIQTAVSALFAPIGHVGSGGSAHADVTTSADGFMLAADKIKLDTVGTSARVYRTSNQSTSNNTWTICLFSAARWDDRPSGISAQWNSSGRLYCRVSGIYMVTGVLGFLSNNTGLRHIGIYYNGGFIAVERENAEQNDANILSITTLWKATAGGYFELAGKQQSGGNLDMYPASSWGMEFSICKIG